MKLLIVDDSNIVRQRIARAVLNPDMPKLMVVGCARNGLEALRIFKEQDPDVVTMDLTMPEMDGVECTAELMALKPTLRILVISALSDKATALRALKNGAQGFLYKPFTDEGLVEAIAEIIT